MTQLTTTLPASQARSDFYTLLSEVGTKLKRFTITRHGRAQAVIMHPEEVEAWEETMKILANKKLLFQLGKSENERRKNEVVAEKELLEQLKISPEELQ